MEIAKGIHSHSYQQLDLSDYNNLDWEIAIDILDKRLTERYIEPVEILRMAEKDKPPSEKKFGFTIMAINCLLIETVQSFYEGVIDSSRLSKALFKNFLLNRENFKVHFPNQADAKFFYENYRCGILHQAQTFKGARIWTVGQLINRTGQEVVINRDLFYQALVKEKDLYINLLRGRNDTVLLANFKKKMDFIAST